MEREKILKIARELLNKTTVTNFYARSAEVKNLIQVYAGKQSSFYEAVEKVKITASQAPYYLDNIIDSFIRAMENDLISSVSYQRRIKIEVVNEYLLQAEDLLELGEFHPAPAAVLIGASLEEFLRNWVSDENLNLGSNRSSIDGYAKSLKENEHITKQEYKEITAWAGLRNDAAHGKWNSVEDRDKISIMLKGVSLFIKQHSK